MKNILIALAMLIAAPAFPTAAMVTASVNAVPVAYDATPGSKLVTCPTSSELEVYNNTSSIIAVGLGVNAVLPTYDYSIVSDGPGTNRIYKSKDGSVLFGNNTMVYIRSMSGSPISAGQVAVTCVN